MSAVVFMLAAVLLALQVRDFKTTMDGLKQGAKEKGLVKSPLIAKGLAIVVVVLLVFLHAETKVIAVPIILALAVVYYGWVIYNNIKVKQKLKNV